VAYAIAHVSRYTHREEAARTAVMAMDRRLRPGVPFTGHAISRGAIVIAGASAAARRGAIASAGTAGRLSRLAGELARGATGAGGAHL